MGCDKAMHAFCGAAPTEGKMEGSGAMRLCAECFQQYSGGAEEAKGSQPETPKGDSSQPAPAPAKEKACVRNADCVCAMLPSGLYSVSALCRPPMRTSFNTIAIYTNVLARLSLETVQLVSLLHFVLCCHYVDTRIN
jgi:hypothetical protein